MSQLSQSQIGERKRSTDTKNINDHKDTDNDQFAYEGNPRSSSQVNKLKSKGPPSNKFASVKKGTFEKEKKVVSA